MEPLTSLDMWAAINSIGFGNFKGFGVFNTACVISLTIWPLHSRLNRALERIKWNELGIK